MDVNKQQHFFETASIFEENWIERSTINALRNHATGAGMGVLVQIEVINSSGDLPNIDEDPEDETFEQYDEEKTTKRIINGCEKHNV